MVDLFSNNGILLFKNSEPNFKTKIGGILTIIQSLISLVIIVYLSSRKFEIYKGSYSKQIDYFKDEIGINMLFKYPEKYLNYTKWYISKLNYRESLIDDKFHVCTDKEYKNFYDLTNKEKGMAYICRTENITELSIYYMLSICNHKSAPSSCEEIVEEDYLENINFYSGKEFNGEFFLQYSYYNETLLSSNLEIVKDRAFLNNNNNLLRKIYNFNLRKTILNNNIWTDDIKQFTWYEHIYDTLITEDSGNLIDLNLSFNSYFVNYISTEKINERVISTLSILSILNLIISLISSLFTRYYFNLHILMTYFNTEEIKQMSIFLKITHFENTNYKFDDKACLHVIISIYSLKNYLLSYINSKNDRYRFVEKMIINKLSIENILIQNNKHITTLDTNTNNKYVKPEILDLNNFKFTSSSSFLKSLDFFSDDFYLLFKNEKRVTNYIGKLVTIVFSAFALLITYYFGFNFLFNKNPNVTLYTSSIYNMDFAFEKKINSTIFVTVTEGFAHAKRPGIHIPFTESYTFLEFKLCSFEEIAFLKTFNLTLPSNVVLSHLCISYLDIFKFEENSIKDKEIRWVNCSEIIDIKESYNNCTEEFISKNDVFYTRIDMISYDIDPNIEQYKIPKHFYFEKQVNYSYLKDEEELYFGDYGPADYEFVTSHQVLEFNDNKLIENYIRENVLSIKSANSGHIDWSGYYRSLLFLELTHDENIVVIKRSYDMFQNCLSTILSLNTLLYSLIYFFYKFIHEYILLKSYSCALSTTTLETNFLDFKSFSLNNISKVTNLKINNNEIELNNQSNNFLKINSSIEAEEGPDKETFNQKLNEMFFEEDISFINFISYKFNPKLDYKYKIVFNKVSQIASLENLLKNKNDKTTKSSLLFFFDNSSDLKGYLSINNEYRFQTNIGGTLFIILILLIIPVFYIFGKDYWNNSNPIITSNTLSTEEANKYNITYINLDPKLIAYVDTRLCSNSYIMLEHYSLNTLLFDFYHGYTKDYPCSIEKINSLEDQSIYFDYTCFNHTSLFSYFIKVDDGDLTNINYICENLLYQEISEFKYGLNFHYSKSNFSSKNNFLSSINENIKFVKLEKGFPFFYLNFQYNVFRDDIGIFYQKYAQYEYLSLEYKGILEKNFEEVDGMNINIKLDNKINVYNRRYKRLLAVIRECLSILILIAAVFKFTAQLFSDFYCEKYLFEFFEKNDLFSIKKDIKKDKDETNMNKVVTFKSKFEYGLSNITDNRFRYSKLDENRESSCLPEVVVEEIVYEHKIFDFILDKVPFISNYVDNGYAIKKKIILEKLSIEKIIV